ncbi:MAG: long-chain fatty acid--CoA ligase [Solirubrobacteraceae bacterium]
MPGLVGLSMNDYQLSIAPVMSRAETLFARKPIVSRCLDGSRHEYSYGEMAERARRLSVALRALGIERGDRVASLCWNHHQHLEAYFGVPLAGAVLHTLNLRLHASDLTQIVNHARDRLLLVDASLWPVWEAFRSEVDIERVVVVNDGGDLPAGVDVLDYDDLIAGASSEDFEDLGIHETEAAAMCFTSGTTGGPKGVVYSHRAIVLHSLCQALPSVLDFRESDTVMLVAPMFHVNGWGFPYTSALIGCRQVLVGPSPTATSVLELITQERASIVGAVPTVCRDLLNLLDHDPGRYDVSSVRMICVASSAVPQAMIEAFEERHGIRIVQAWGMTETAPTGLVSLVTEEIAELEPKEQFRSRARQGQPIPLFEIRANGEQGLVPWDGQSQGELEVRSPWVASNYFENAGAADRFTDDGWLRTGDVVTIDPHGFVEIRDRAKDLIKSGGEWISSVALENALMAHPAVAEAAVIGIPDERWQERPLAIVALRPGASASASDLESSIRERFAKWWLPDDYVFVDEIPKTPIGKFRKNELRASYSQHAVPS